MAGSQENNASLFDEETTLSESSQACKSQNYEEENFYRNCRAAYLAVFKSSLEKITSKEQLTLALQQAGRNPSQKTVNKYWTLQTTTLNFDDFCFLLRQEEPVEETDLLRAFSKLDPNNDGYILHSELHKILTNRGEKMTTDEINKITELAGINNDGKFDYHKFCKLYMTTSEQCLRTALKKLESDNKLECQQFGSQLETSSETATSPMSKTLPKIAKKVESKPVLKRDSWKTSLQYSSAPSGQPCVRFNIIMDVSSNRNSELTAEAHVGKESHCAQSKGCFFIQDDGEIISHRYKMILPQRSAVCITIKPVDLHQRRGKNIN